MYTDCEISVTDLADNQSLRLSVTPFSIDTNASIESEIVYDIPGLTNQNVTATLT
jgi:hypothetical protein